MHVPCAKSLHFDSLSWPGSGFSIRFNFGLGFRICLNGEVGISDGNKTIARGESRNWG